MALELAEIGLDQEALQERVVAAIVDRLLTTGSVDDEGDCYYRGSAFKNQLDKLIEERINATVAALAEKHVLPNVTSYIENLLLTETNKWGEKKGKAVTFIEYLVQRADAYMREQVDFDGKSKEEKNDYGQWSGKQTRITHLVHKHLQYSIESAMQQVMKDANGYIVEGIEETVKLKLEELAKKLKIAVQTK